MKFGWPLLFVLILLILAVGLIGTVILYVPVSGYVDPYDLQWQSVTPPEPDMECWAAWWRGSPVAVCR